MGGRNVNLAVKRNEILLIDVRHLPRYLLLPPSETVYYETPAAWRINYRHMRSAVHAVRLSSGIALRRLAVRNHQWLVIVPTHVLFAKLKSQRNPRSRTLINGCVSTSGLKTRSAVAEKSRVALYHMPTGNVQGHITNTCIVHTHFIFSLSLFHQ